MANRPNESPEEKSGLYDHPLVQPIEEIKYVTLIFYEERGKSGPQE